MSAHLTENAVFRTICGLYATVIVLAVAGNAVALVLSLCKRRRSLKTIDVQLMNVAVNDLLLACINMPLQLLHLRFYRNWPFTRGHIMCQLMQYVPMVVLINATFSLGFIAIDRLLCVSYPMRYKDSRPLWITGLILALIFVASCLMALPQIFVVFVVIDFKMVPVNATAAPSTLENTESTNELFENVTQLSTASPPPVYVIHSSAMCMELYKKNAEAVLYTGYLPFLCYLAPAIVICSSYGILLSRLHLRRGVNVQWLVQPQQHAVRSLKNRRATLLLSVTSLLFCLGWLPFHIAMLISNRYFSGAGAKTDDQLMINDLLRLVGYTTTGVNPFLYVFTAQETRERLRFWWNRTKRRNVVAASGITGASKDQSRSPTY